MQFLDPTTYTALFDPDDLLITTATYRAHGVVGGTHAVLPRIVASRVRRRSTRILDLGAGPDAPQAATLRAAGFRVAAIDVGRNWRDGIHDADALNRQHDLVYASNLLNVQASPRMLATTIAIMARLLEPDGEMLANYPAEPRKMGLPPARIHEALARMFDSVSLLTPAERCGYAAPVFACRKPRFVARLPA